MSAATDAAGWDNQADLTARFWSDLPELTDDLGRVHDRIVQEAADAGGALGEALSRYVGRRGKMLRPGLTLLGTWAGRGQPGKRASKHIIEIASAIETLHLASLIHDDVIDASGERRGEPSLHALYGNRQAVLMGDYLLSRCFSMISRGTKRENAQALAAATGHLVRGEINQMLESGAPRFSRRAYLRRIAGKTAMLFGLGLVVGAREAKAKEHEIALLARTGYSMGMAFQVIDDILDVTGSSAHLGKPVAADLRAGIYTLPAIEAVAADPGVTDALVPPPSSDDQMQASLAAVTRAGGIREARVKAAHYTLRARRAIESLADPDLRGALAMVSARLLDREY